MTGYRQPTSPIVDGVGYFYASIIVSAVFLNYLIKLTTKSNCLRHQPLPLLAAVFPYFALQNKGKHRHPNLTQKTRPHATNFRRMRAGLFFYSPMLHQYSFDPAGMWSSTMRRCRSSLPSFWLTALMTMPQLSMPIILRGGRLVMAIRVFPTSSSGS